MASPRPTITVYAVKRILNGDYAKADVYSNDKRVATVTRFYNTITITTKRGVFK